MRRGRQQWRNIGRCHLVATSATVSATVIRLGWLANQLMWKRSNVIAVCLPLVSNFLIYYISLLSLVPLRGWFQNFRYSMKPHKTTLSQSHSSWVRSRHQEFYKCLRRDWLSLIHSRSTSYHRWMRLTINAPPGMNEFHRLGWPVDGSGHSTVGKASLVLVGWGFMKHRGGYIHWTSCRQTQLFMQWRRGFVSLLDLLQQGAAVIQALLDRIKAVEEKLGSLTGQSKRSNQNPTHSQSDCQLRWLSTFWSLGTMSIDGWLVVWNGRAQPALCGLDALGL